MKELITIQAKLKVPKTMYNSFGKYNYRSAEGILEAVKPLLNEAECLLTLQDDVALVGGRFYIKATATLTNKDGVSVTTQAFAREDDTKKGMDGSQITGTASSYARKYALNGLFLIDDTKDADTDEYQRQNGRAVDTAAVDKAVTEIRGAETIEAVSAIYKGYQKTNPDICRKGGALYTAAMERANELKQTA